MDDPLTPFNLLFLLRSGVPALRDRNAQHLRHQWQLGAVQVRDPKLRRGLCLC